MSLSEKLARFIVNTSYEDLPEDVVGFTKLCILDWLGSAVAGSSKEPVRIIDELAREMGGAEQASLVTGGKTSLTHAALVNGAASHVVELDDIHKSSIIHAATVVVPAALAVAEWMNKSGKDLIAAVAIGYDVCFRIGEAVSPSHYYFWHNTATCGTFGATAATAKLLDLNEQQIVHALGNAGTQAAGLWEFIVDGAMTKQLHTGKAAMNGLLASLLAQKGFTGPSKILEGDRGFFKAMAETFDEERISDKLGQQFKITENSFKIHASCRHTHPAIDLALKLKKEHAIRPEEIREIRVGGYKAVYDITNNPNPQTVYASKFSLQFCASLAFVKGKAGLADFTEETLWDPAIRALMERVKLTVDPEVDSAYPEKWGSAVAVETQQGEVHRLTTDYPKGDPENPVTADDLVQKFRELAAHLSDSEKNRFVDTVLHLESVSDAADFWKERSRST
ncbi:MmgE/PrpD family protein [Effusibacillus lacus]|uniref:2-methylcitrate dehydratase n=1 Tax=Effusibacillus lacus TaxID=1348429 RepID=A0A292YNR5_9BACL|nr:MmgE/PrpD family protein [Effusibacillus lacus]TCS71605.1 2-methylcitrate dehydratase PrpD [Effusibacillus lacus]GAX90110.1 2-methylcitrate dehydratase [Effusibacillus lacus]